MFRSANSRLKFLPENNMKVISTPSAPAALGPYCQAIDTGNTLYMSGMLGIDPATGVMTEGIENQAKQVLKNLKLKNKQHKYSKILMPFYPLQDIQKNQLLNATYSYQT